MWFYGVSAVFGLAGLISAYNTTVHTSASLGLGIAAAGFSLSTAICSVSVACLLRPGQKGE
jgi:hypothetical protein